MAIMNTICPFCFNKVALTDSYLCPKCSSKIPSGILQTENLLFSIIGVMSSGKTNYITVMLEELNNAKNLNLALSDQNKDTRDHQKENRNRLYEKHTKPERTSSGTLKPQIWLIKKTEPDNILQKISNDRSAYTLIIYDGAGEDYEHLADNPSLCQYIATSKAIMVLIDPTVLRSVKDSLDRDI
jgi:hypothetical protein